MPFDFCNTSVTFQHCMIYIFSDIVEDSIEVFMNIFSIVGNSFDDFLDNLSNAFLIYEECNLVLNWEKCQFIVKEGIVLGHKILKKGTEVDNTKIEVIENLPPLIFIKGIQSFLGHAGF